MFGVTTDYLLKDEIEDEESIDSNADSKVKCVTLAKANEFLGQRKSASIRIAAATFLCILSVIPFLILGAMAEYSLYGMSYIFAGVVGWGILLVMVAIAAAIFIFCGFQSSPYKFLNKDMFDTEYGVKGMVRERQTAYKNIYATCNIIGTCVCVILLYH